MNTKVKALMKQIESGKMKSDQARILNLIIGRNSSAVDITLLLNLKMQTVVGRISDLLDIGIIEAFSTEVVNGYDYNIYKYQSDPFRQARNAYDRKMEKFKLWKKRGELEFSDILQANQIELELK